MYAKKICVLALMTLASGIFPLQSFAYVPTKNEVTYNVAQSDRVLQAGSIIPAVLVTRINSDSLSPVIVAVVRESVYDSATGTNVLIPAGSKLIGEANQLQADRMQVSFTRIIFPNGHSVLIPDYEGTDTVGANGLKDKYSRHTWVKFRTVLTGSLVAGAAAALSPQNQSKQIVNKDGNLISIQESPVQEAINGAISNMLQGIQNITEENNQDIKPTGIIREGYLFNVILHSDIEIKPYKSM